MCGDYMCVFHYVIEDFDFFLKGNYIDFFVFAFVHMNDLNGLYFFSCKTKIGSLGGIEFSLLILVILLYFLIYRFFVTLVYFQKGGILSFLLLVVLVLVLILMNFISFRCFKCMRCTCAALWRLYYRFGIFSCGWKE